MSEPTPNAGEGRKHWRKLKRQDTGLALFDEARACVHDAARCKRIVFELSRLYNPVIDGPLVDRTTYARLVAALEDGRVDEARGLLDERLALYAPGDTGGPDPDRYRGGAGPFFV